jgi:DNA invertase Pin-like site-specific DNA recombinase
VQVAIYVRVNTADQNQELQLRELQDYANRHQWEIAQVYQDTISGASASRPGLNQLMDDARARKVDIVLCWKLDRFGRSLLDCLANLRELDTHGVRFIATTQALDTDNRNPASKFLLHVLGAAAEFERELIRERSSAGRARYLQDYRAGRVGKTVSRRSGKNLAPHRPKRIFDRDKVAQLRAQGLSIRQIAAKLGIGVGTAARTLQAVPKVCSGELEQ